jgi:chromate transport protein ChrA
LLQGVPPVVLVLTLKSVTRMLSSLDGEQRIVAIVSCALATLGKMRILKTRTQFVFPALMVFGGLFTFLEDFRSESIAYKDTPPQISSAFDGDDAVFHSSEAPTQRGFGGISDVYQSKEPVAIIPRLQDHSDITYETDLPMDVKEKFETDLPIDVKEEMDEYADDYFDTNYQEYFSADPVVFSTGESSEENIDYQEYFSADPVVFSTGEPSEEIDLDDPTNYDMGNQTTTLFQQARGGSIGQIARLLHQNESRPVLPGVYALVLWLSVLLFTTFIKCDNALYGIFAMNYRVGSMVFGGGPIMVPLLAAEFVHKSLSESQFFQGASIAEALPGSIFNFAAYVGAMQEGWKGAVAAHVGIFAPGVILVFAMLPIWSRVREQAWFRSTSRGVTAAAVGLLGSACLSTYTTCIKKGTDFMLFLASLCSLPFTEVGAPVVVLLGAVLGVFLTKLNLDQMTYQ